MADNLNIRSLVANELVDIEPLMEPGLDWGAWLQTASWLISGLLILMLVLYFARFLYRPILFKWQLNRLLKQAKKVKSEMVKSELLVLYHWFIEFEAWFKKANLKKTAGAPKQNFNTAAATQYKVQLTDFRAQLNEACFSNCTVSRETSFYLISQAGHLVKSLEVFSGCFDLFFKSIKVKREAP